MPCRLLRQVSRLVFVISNFNVPTTQQSLTTHTKSSQYLFLQKPHNVLMNYEMNNNKTQKVYSTKQLKLSRGFKSKTQTFFVAQTCMCTSTNLGLQKTQDATGPPNEPKPRFFPFWTHMTDFQGDTPVAAPTFSVPVMWQASSASSTEPRRIWDWTKTHSPPGGSSP